MFKRNFNASVEDPVAYGSALISMLAAREADKTRMLLQTMRPFLNETHASGKLPITKDTLLLMYLNVQDAYHERLAGKPVAVRREASAWFYTVGVEYFQDKVREEVLKAAEKHGMKVQLSVSEQQLSHHPSTLVN